MRTIIRRTYKRIGNIRLQLQVFLPTVHGADDRCAAIIFFHGGGWENGSPRQFKPHAEYLASRGVTAFTVEYRLNSKHQASPFDAMEDARDAIRWVRANASVLGIDPERICAAGGSAGGHLAASTAVFRDTDGERDGLDIDAIPNLLILFNPVLDITVSSDRIKEKFQNRDRDASPFYHMRKWMPPTIIFHGNQDAIVPVESIRRYEEKMKECGGCCQLFVFEGMEHGFFNYDQRNGMYKKTLNLAEQFLEKRGYL